MRDKTKRVQLPFNPNQAESPASETAGLPVLLLYIFSLWGFVVAQPIYTDLFKDGGYFRAHQLPVSDIWLALFLISFALPGAWMLILWLIGRFFPQLARATGQVLIILFLSCFCMLVLRGFPAVPTLLKLALSIIAGIQLTRLLLHKKENNFLLCVTVPGAILFPIWFLLNCPLTTPFNFDAHGNAKSPLSHKALKTPVVMILFDELPLNSLLNEHGQIDAVNYPNFSALAQNATWFPNAVTVHSITRGAVPAILTGKYPPATFDWAGLFSGHHDFNCTSPLPTTESFPNTLFSLLEKSHTMQVFESRIYLCNSAGCQNRLPLASLKQRTLLLMQRCGEEYLFKILFNNNEMNKFYFDFKSIRQKNETPDDPEKQEASLISHDYDLEQFQKFLSALQPLQPHQRQAPFYFIHPILPHSPWEFYPSGKRYAASQMIDLSADVLCEHSPSLLYCQNTEHSRSTYQRHLLQAGYADTLLGQTIARLKATHLYDQSLIIITADHGISFLPFEHRRPVNEKNYGDILPIPLLIKQPNQQLGKVDTREAETVDIVPTVAHNLHLSLNWRTDRESLLKPNATRRDNHTICSPKVRLKFTAHQIQQARQKALQQKFNLFGSLSLHPGGLFNTCTHRGLIGQALGSNSAFGASFLRFQLTQAVNTRSDPQPVLLSGHIVSPQALNSPETLLNTDLAVVINNTIVATGQPFHYNEALHQADFAILLPEHSYQPVADTLQLFETKGATPQFYRITGQNRLPPQ